MSWIVRLLSWIVRLLRWIGRLLSWIVRLLSWIVRLLSWIVRLLSWIGRLLGKILVTGTRIGWRAFCSQSRFLLLKNKTLIWYIHVAIY